MFVRACKRRLRTTKSELSRQLEAKKAFYEDEIAHLNDTVARLKTQLSEMDSRLTHTLTKDDIGSLQNINVV